MAVTVVSTVVIRIRTGDIGDRSESVSSSCLQPPIEAGHVDG